MSDPVSGAIVAIATFFGASTATAVGIAVVATPIVVSAAKLAATAFISAALTPKPKPIGGTSLDFKADLDAGIPGVIGRTATAGNLIFQYPYGKKNRMLALFCIISGMGAIQGIDSFTADQQLVTFNTSGVVTNNPSFKDQMFMTTRLGATPDTALSQPGGQATADGSFSYWTSAHKLSGYASAWWVCQYDSDKLSSLPKPQWVVRGTKVYDPRKDSTYPGGTGSHRVDNPATWEWTENPYLHGLQWCLGYFQNGKKIAGVGAPVSAIDVPAFVNGANVADAHGWKVGGVVSSTDSKWQVLKGILQAGSGEPMQMGAKISCSVNAPKTSLATIVTGDLAGAPSVQAMMSARDRINTIVPRYRSEAHNWEVVAASPVTSATYVTEDGGQRSRGVEYSLCQNLAQAGVLAAYDIVNSREVQPITLPVKPRWIGYLPGDCVTINIPEMGLNNQKAVILRRSSPNPTTGVVNLTLRSETDAKHSYALGITAVAPPTPGLTVPDFATVAAPLAGQWTAAASTTTGTGLNAAAIDVTGSASDNPFAAQIVVEYRVHGTTNWIMWPSSPATATTITITGVAGTTSYDIAVSYVTIYGVHGARLILSPVVSPNGTVTYTDGTDINTLKPSEPGADVTGNHTSNDTAHVGGRPASELVAEIATLASQISSLAGGIIAQIQRVYDPAVTYHLYDIVSYSGRLYKAKGDTTGNLPTNTTYWAYIGDYTSVADALIGQAGGIAGNASAITAITARTTSLENVTTTQSSQITSLNSSLTTVGGAASANAAAISAIDTRVTATEGALTTQATNLSTVSGQVGTLSASVTTVSSVQGVQDGKITTIQAFYGVNLDAGGRAIGWAGLNDGHNGGFKFSADYVTFESISTGARLEWSSGNIRTYDSSGNLRTQMGSW